METFYVLVKYFGTSNSKKQFGLFKVEARNSEAAWEMVVEGDYATNNSQEWLLTEQELKELKITLN